MGVSVSLCVERRVWPWRGNVALVLAVGGSERVEERTCEDAMLPEKLVCVVTTAIRKQDFKPPEPLQWWKFQALLWGPWREDSILHPCSQPNRTTNPVLEVHASSAHPCL